MLIGLSILMDSASRSLGGRKLGDVKKLIEQMGLTVEFVGSPAHRAEEDARRLAQALRGSLRQCDHRGTVGARSFSSSATDLPSPEIA
jgi:hypothetical protein